jgi:hypothetical protein
MREKVKFCSCHKSLADVWSSFAHVCFPFFSNLGCVQWRSAGIKSYRSRQVLVLLIVKKTQKGSSSSFCVSWGSLPFAFHEKLWLNSNLNLIWLESRAGCKSTRELCNFNIFTCNSRVARFEQDWAPWEETWSFRVGCNGSRKLSNWNIFTSNSRVARCITRLSGALWERHMEL